MHYAFCVTPFQTAHFIETSLFIRAGGWASEDPDAATEACHAASSFSSEVQPGCGLPKGKPENRSVSLLTRGVHQQSGLNR